MSDSAALFLETPLVLLGAAVLAVPIAKRLGLGSVVGYLIAGILIGPQVLAFFKDAGSVLSVAELGIVMFLFLIGLEMNPSRVWSMRRDIFGLGSTQMLVTGLVCACVPLVFGRPVAASLVAGFGLAITSTAIMMQILTEHGEVASPHGQRAFAVSIFQDLMIVPLLAMVAFLSPLPAEAGEVWWIGALKIVGALAAVIVAGRYLLNPMFRLLAKAGAREIMTAAALLVVIGSAAIMVAAGLSMAMGAFLAGVFLAESNFRHELEADIEPFRGILMGLFFLSVGMTVDLAVIMEGWWRILIGLSSLILLKGAVMYGLMRLFGHDHHQSVKVGLLIAQGGEFGFVLNAAAVAAGVMTAEHASVLVAIVVLSMAVNPFLFRLLPILSPKTEREAPVEDFSDARGEALVIGFGRFGQVVSQVLRTTGIKTTIIDNDVEMIETAGRFGSKVYYGDGSRLDVLRAAGAAEAEVIVVAVDDRAAAVKIVELVKSEFPVAKVYARAYDRQHAIALLNVGVDLHVRETFESALEMGRRTIDALGVDDLEAQDIIVDVRERDLKRLALQQAGGIAAGRDLIATKRALRPEPLEEDKRQAIAINPDAIKVAEAARDSDR
jgi:monovalent cation:proton antiporter-2 (CPA2) family protein